MVYAAALYHDIGKKMIPICIRCKPGSLTERERFLMQAHTMMGYSLLLRFESKLGISAIVALQHHERLDGSGYLGLRDFEIHPHAKLVAVADVFDALLSPRPYKNPWSIRRVCDHLAGLSGAQMDATIVNLLLENTPRVLALYREETRISAKMRISTPYTHSERSELAHAAARRTTHYPLADRVWGSA